ncbi:MAG TPA: SsrA-binding protein SmpB [Saprospiraceae bacterium]|nr:SsrA-binding protein [Saprospirales bacterium]HRQ31070.1 SsrA-binding protein SmpB [Saprospiraceae bacterium]
MAGKKNIEIVNKKATFEFYFLQTFEAGISLTGTEVKSIRLGNANLKDAYCSFKDGELYVKSLFISEYKFGNIFNHESRRDRKLLLRKSELNKLDKKVKEKGLTIIPYRIFLTDRGFIKIEIALAQGKKAYDKRVSIKEKDLQRDLDRHKK